MSYTIKKCGSDDDSSDIEDINNYKKGGYHYVSIGDVFNERYTIEKKLGWGEYSTVWMASDKEVSDNHPFKLVALKIIKSSLECTNVALDEIKLLRHIKEKEQETNRFKSIVQLLDNFMFVGPNGKHICLIFELMDSNLLSLIKRYQFKGISLKLCKQIINDILIGLDFLHEKCEIIHTDIKPDNLVITLDKKNHIRKKSPEDTNIRTKKKVKIMSSSIPVSENQPDTIDKIKNDHHMEQNIICKIADLGNACWTYKHYTENVSARIYRSPEVIVGLPYSTPIDIWSLACVVFELVTGDLLFDIEEDNNSYQSDQAHIALMIELLGDMPKQFTSEGKYSEHIFNQKGELKTTHNLNHMSMKEVLKQKYKLLSEEAYPLADFLNSMLEIDPSKRIKAKDALNHPWLTTPSFVESVEESIKKFNENNLFIT